MEAVQNLPAHQQQEFMKQLEQMQLKDSLTYVPLTNSMLSESSDFLASSRLTLYRSFFPFAKQ